MGDLPLSLDAGGRDLAAAQLARLAAHNAAKKAAVPATAKPQQRRGPRSKEA